jgi:hypothetical protein
MPDKNRFPRVLKTASILIVSLILLLVVAWVGYVVWYLFSTHIDNPAASTTPADVTHYTSVPPPPEAREIRVEAFEYGQARLTFVRFSAPVDVCRKYAAAVMPNTTLTLLSWDQRYNDLGAIFAGSNQLHDLRWFDLPYAKSFWTLQSGQPVFQHASGNIPEAPEIVGADANTAQKGYLTTSVRVDVSRGVFYFLQEN